MPDNMQIPPALAPNVEPQPTSYVNPQEVAMAKAQTGAPLAHPGTPNVSEDPRAPESMQQVLDLRSGKVQPVPTSQIASLVSSGMYELPSKGDQYVIHKETGKLIQIPNNNYKNAMQSGEFLPANDHDIRQEMYKQKYGDKGLEAFATATARGATLGLSDVALRASGVSAGRLAGLEEANPTLSLTGEIVGTAGAALLPVGPAALATKAGVVAERAAVRVAEKAVIEAGITGAAAKSIVGKVVPGMVGGAVEASFYGVGNVISEDMLGKADFNAENLIAGAGAGAILGAGFGGAFAAIREAAPVVANIAKEKLEKTGITNKVENARELLGGKAKVWEKKLARDPNFGDDVVHALQDENKIGLSEFDSIEKVSEKVQNFKQNSGERVSAELSKISNIAEKNPEILPEAKDVFKRLRKEAESAAAELEASKGVPLPENKAEHAAIMQYKEQYELLENAAAKGERLDVNKLQDMRKNLDIKAQYDRTSNTDPVRIITARTMRGAMRTEIDNLADRAGSVVGQDILAPLKAANRDYHIAASIADSVEEKAAKGVAGASLKDIAMGILLEHGVGGKFTIALAAMKKLIQSDFRRKMVILGNVEKANVAMNKLVDSSAGKFFTAGVNAGGTAVKAQTIRSLSEFELSKNAEGKRAKTQQEAFNNISANLRSLAASPQRTLELTNKHTAGIHDVAPNTSAALDMIGANALAFLGSKMPTRVSEPGIMAREYKPSSLELSKFERYINAVQDPKQVLEHFSNGKMSREEAETIKTVYPNLFGRMQDKAMEFIGANPNLPYQKKLQLGILLDTNTDPSLNPQSILALQHNFQAANQEPAQTGASSQKSSQNLQKSDRMSLGPEED
jgi:hypothetical protein